MLEAKPDPMIARDLIGYGARPRDPRRPDNALIAVNFNINVEAGDESTLTVSGSAPEPILRIIGNKEFPART
jgi:allantoinase